MSEDFTFTYRKTVITLADPRLLRSASRDEGGDAWISECMQETGSLQRCSSVMGRSPLLDIVWLIR